MPRHAKGPGPRSDGVMTPGNASPVGAGQPNGRTPYSGIPQATAAGAGAPMPYGEAGQLQAAAAQTPAPPPGVTPQAHGAHLAAKGYRPNVTPLFAPTTNSAEPVTAGAPLSPGPTHPMAMAGMDQPSNNAAMILAQAADASGSPMLRALAARAQAMMGSASE